MTNAYKGSHRIKHGAAVLDLVFASSAAMDWTPELVKYGQPLRVCEHLLHSILGSDMLIHAQRLG